MKSLHINNLLLRASLLCFALLFSQYVNASSFTPEQRQDIQNEIHDYLVNNPSVLVEAAKSLQQQQQSKSQKHFQDAITQQSSRLFESPNTPSVGNSQASINIVEFFDYQDPSSRRMALVLLNIMNTDRDLRVVFKESPTMGPISVLAAKAALAAARQDKFLVFHNALLTSKKPLDANEILDIAKRTGLNIKRLEADMMDANIQQQLDENVQIAKALGVTALPSFVVATNPVLDPRLPIKAAFISGPITDQVFKNVIAQLRKK